MTSCRQWKGRVRWSAAGKCCSHLATDGVRVRAGVHVRVRFRVKSRVKARARARA